MAEVLTWVVIYVPRRTGYLASSLILILTGTSAANHTYYFLHDYDNFISQPKKYEDSLLAGC